ncbi:putative membrane protein [Escherichia coli 2-222-05_S3_C3]|nr:putative membrane protein [Escherichia coli 2-222-05_S3_C3]
MMSSIKLLLHLPFVMFVIAELLLVILVIVACIALEKRKHIN